MAQKRACKLFAAQVSAIKNSAQFVTVKNTINPILTAWAEILAQKDSEAALLGMDGSPLRTFAEIEAEARSLQATLPAVAPGTVVAVQTGNDPRFPAFLLALWRASCVPMPLDRSVEKDALRAALAASGAGIHITREGFAAVAGGAPVDADFLKLTSGTTGSPRAIRFRAGQLAADCDAVCDTMGLRGDDVNFGVIPWSHSYGFSNLLTPLLCRGIAVALTDDRMPRALLNGLAATGATVFPGLPVFFQKLAELDSAPLPMLRLCISAGAPLSRAVADAFRARYGLKVHSFYGSSECGGITYDASEEDIQEGCAGQPMRGVSLSSEGENVDEPSRYAIQSGAVGEGYYPDPEPAVLNAGRFTPCDLLLRTPQGFILAGRVSDFINVAGRKLNPADVEACLRECPGVREIIVFGVPHALRGEEPIACVVGEATAEQITQFAQARLSPWQTPRCFWKADALPVNERGKLNRRELARRYLATL